MGFSVFGVEKVEAQPIFLRNSLLPFDHFCLEQNLSQNTQLIPFQVFKARGAAAASLFSIIILSSVIKDIRRVIPGSTICQTKSVSNNSISLYGQLFAEKLNPTMKFFFESPRFWAL
jgi:hypothetical protein